MKKLTLKRRISRLKYTEQLVFRIETDKNRDKYHKAAKLHKAIPMHDKYKFYRDVYSEYTLALAGIFPNQHDRKIFIESNE